MLPWKPFTWVQLVVPAPLKSSHIRAANAVPSFCRGGLSLRMKKVILPEVRAGSATAWQSVELTDEARPAATTCCAASQKSGFAADAVTIPKESTASAA